MKINVLSENIQKKLSFLNHAVSSKSQLPILLNFLLEGKGGKFFISSTDLEIGIKVEIPAHVEEEGSTTVSARRFSDLLSSVPEGKIELTKIDSQLSITGSKIKSIFQTISDEEFPSLYTEMGEEILQLNNESLIGCITSVFFAASIDSTRPALSGVLLQKEEDGFILVATDGYRLSVKKFPQQESSTQRNWSKGILIPARLLRETLSLKQEGEIKVFVSDTNNQILFLTEDSVLVGRLIDAEFPPYSKIIPTNHQTEILVDKEELMKAIKITSVFARDAANIVKMSIQKEKTVISANAPSVGENMVEIESKLTGEENEIAFNAKYLQDMLTNVTAKELIFQMNAPLQPGVFKIKEDSSFLHIIMPIRVQS